MTNSPIKLLFDECIGWPVMDDLARLAKYDTPLVEFGHAVRLGFGGINDEIWIPKIAGEGWMIVTADAGKHPKAGSGEKLPALCKKWRVTYAVLSRSLAKAKSRIRIQAILEVWDDLLAMSEHPRGSGFSIRPSSGGHFSLALFRPVEVPNIGPPPIQLPLLPDE